MVVPTVWVLAVLGESNLKRARCSVPPLTHPLFITRADGLAKKVRIALIERMGVDKILLAAQGYIELDMPEEAIRELDSLPAEDRQREPALQLRLFVVMRSRQWQRALDVCEAMRSATPEIVTGYIHGAFCLHEMGRTAEARKLLLAAPSHLRKEPTYHYNLGCYAAVLGELEEARHHLTASFELDKKFRDIALQDPDLRSVKDFL